MAGMGRVFKNATGGEGLATCPQFTLKRPQRESTSELRSEANLGDIAKRPTLVGGAGHERSPGASTHCPALKHSRMATGFDVEHL